MQSVVVLGGGLAGMSAALQLAAAPRRFGPITLVEQGRELGGLAGGFEQDGRAYPLGYHHILDRDDTLLGHLGLLGLLERVSWRRIRMLFEVGGRIHDLRRLGGLLSFPLGLVDKARFAWLLARAARKADWSDWDARSAAELVDAWAGAKVRERMFEPLTRIKFGLPCREVSASWLGARLHHREGSAPLGRIPGASWTKLLCDGLAAELARCGVVARTATRVVALESSEGRVTAARLSDGTTLRGDLFVSALPTVVWCALAPDEATPALREVRYTALVSAIAAAPADGLPDFYWLNCLDPGSAASGLFRLDGLDPSLARPGEAILNFVTHLPGRDDERFAAGDETWLARFGADFTRLFRRPFRPRWTRVNRLGLYSPVFRLGYRNPPVRSATFANVWFAGNYRSHPTVASTGTALRSGIEAAEAIVAAQRAAG